MAFVTYDLLVVGAGSAGLVGARTAASLGASVLLVERDRMGGDCLWTGCVPSKALLAAASAAADARAATRFGVHTAGVTVDFPAVLAYVRSAIATIEPVDSAETLQAAGVEVWRGQAQFTGPSSAEVGGLPVSFRRALLATGSDPAVPAIPGLAGALTSDTVWDLTALPTRLTVVGGGAVGCELGQAFARLGSEVTIVEAADRVLAAEIPEASSLVTEALSRDGVTVLTGTAVTAVEDDRVVLADGRTAPAEVVLVALGRRPDTHRLGLDAAGVTVGRSGHVVVDDRLRTSNPRIWAAGDVTGHPQFTHVAGVHGALAATNAVLGLRRRVDPVVPRVTFTAPEVASVGAATGHAVHTVQHADTDRAIADGRPTGFATLVLDRRGRVIGATVVGPRAGETLAELTLAVRRGLRAQDLAGVMHPYPTYGDAPWNAAIDTVRARLATPATRRALGLLTRLRRLSR